MGALLFEFGLRWRLSFTLLMQKVSNDLAKSPSEDRTLSVCRRMSLFFPYRGHWHPRATLWMIMCHHTDGILIYACKLVNENCPMLGIGCAWNSVKEDSGEWADKEALWVRFSRRRSCWILCERMKKNILGKKVHESSSTTMRESMGKCGKTGNIFILSAKCQCREDGLTCHQEERLGGRWGGGK